jgi:hypothetical protein
MKKRLKISEGGINVETKEVKEVTLLFNYQYQCKKLFVSQAQKPNE